VSFSPAEKTVFLICLAAALYGFWFRFGKVVRRIRQSKPDPGFTLKPIDNSIRNFF
jgi:hypothetical protein